MIAKHSDPWLSATLLVVSIATLGRAMQVGDGILKDGAFPWFALGFASCIGAVLLPARGRISYGRIELITALAAVLVCQVGQMLARTPFNEVLDESQWFSQYRWGIVGAALFCTSALLARGWIRHIAFSALLLTHVLLGASIIRASPEPHQDDVFIFQRDSARALARGQNPYAITFPNVIGREWYGEGVSVNGTLQFGYPYMPLSLFLSLPGHLLGGDYRYAQVLATTLAAALIAYTKPSVISFAAVAILLFQPRGMYIVERGWSDPFVVLTLAATVFCAVRLPRLMPWALGLFLASKQYAPFALGAAILLVGEPLSWRRAGVMFGKSAIAAMVVTLPLALWDFADFWKSAVVLQFHQIYRWDSLSFVAWWMDGNRVLPRWALLLPAIAFVLSMVAVLWRCQRTAAGFAAGTALVLFSFFAFNKQAFGNYYYVVIGAMCCAIAAAVPEN